MRRKNIAVSAGFDYFFVKPTKRANVHASARRLMNIKEVMEVAITEGDYGFVIKAEQAADELHDLNKKIAKAVGGSSTKAVCYCRYGKARA